MQLDELRELWAAQGARLERSLALNEQLLRERMHGRIRRAVLPYAAWRGLEAVLGIAFLAAIAPVVAAHASEPRYIMIAGALALYAAGVTAFSARLVVGSLRLDYGLPVTAIQRDVERTRLAEYRALKWAVLGGVLMWLPAALVLFEAVTGIDALARVHFPWLVANVVLGVIVLAIGQALSRKYVERPDLEPWARRLLDALSDRSLRRAASHIEELARFERE